MEKPKGDLINRRDFVKTTGVAAASVLLAGSLSAASVTPLARKRYAMIGTGHRGTGMWGNVMPDGHFGTHTYLAKMSG